MSGRRVRQQPTLRADTKREPTRHTMTLQLLVLYMGVINMKKFEIGKEYFDRSACNHDCIFTIKIIKRTEKTVTLSLAILRRVEPSSALLACLIPVSFTAAFSLWSCMTAQRLLNVSACPTFTAAGGALPAALRWVCSSLDALPGRRFPPLRFSCRCIYRNGAKFFCFFAFSLLTLY